MSNHHPRYPLHQLLTPEFGFGHDIILRVFNGDGEVEGDLKAHGIILAFGSSVLKELLFSQSGELATWKVVEAKGATMKTAKWMLDFLYMKPDKECGWDDASAEEIFQLASLADQFQIVELQEKAEAMLSAFPMEKEDILEVASIAVHFETHFPTASKALLDKCTSLLVSTMHTAEDVARFAEQASKDSHLAPLVVKLLAGMGNSKKLFQEVTKEKTNDYKKAQVAAQIASQEAAGTENNQEQKTSSPLGAQDLALWLGGQWPPSLKAYVSKCFDACVTIEHKDMVEIILKGKIAAAAATNSLWTKEWEKEELPGVLAKAQASKEAREKKELRHASASVKRGEILSAVLKNVEVAEKEMEVCLNCKAVKANCRNGQEVSFISLAQVGCRVVTKGPYWSGDCQGMLATVMKALDSETMTVRWEVEWSSKAGKLRRVGTLTTYKLFPPVPHAKGKPVFRYLCT